MKYKLRNNYSKEPLIALEQILRDRGVEDIDNFVKPTSKCELNPYDLDNIESGAQMLLRHLRNNSSICFVVD